MSDLDIKIILVGGLFLALILARVLAGNKPYNTPVRRPRRFGHAGVEGPLNQPPEAQPKPHLKVVEPPPRDIEDIEKDFFKEK